MKVYAKKKSHIAAGGYIVAFCVMTSPMIKTHRGAVLSTLSTRLYHFSDIYTICVVVSTIDIAGFAFIII